MQLINLLKEWNALEPGRLRIVRDTGQLLILDFQGVWAEIETSAPGWKIEAIVQGAVQEAIASIPDSASELRYNSAEVASLRGYSSKIWFAYIRIYSGCDQGWREFSAEGDSAAIALLSAYLKHLQEKVSTPNSPVISPKD